MAKHKDLVEICDLFNQAENHLKLAEKITAELTVPAINELRYAGYHIAEAYKEEVSDNPELSEIADQVDKAKSHCQRAFYDSSEIIILYFLEEIQSFKVDYKSVSVTEVVPNYIEILHLAEETQSLIQEVENNGKDKRENYYKECFEQLDKLKPIVKTLAISREELNKKIEKENIAARNVILGLSFSVVGIVLIVVFGVLRLVAP